MAEPIDINSKFMKPKGKPVKWNSRIAYIVGLITTDGNLSPDGRHLMIVSKDVSLLKTFKRCLGLKNKIGLRRSGYTGKKDCHHVQFGNVILYKWLVNIGLMPNKTKRIGSLKIPNKYYFDFLRGHLDGDGDICRYQDQVYPGSERLYIRFCSASLKHIQWLRKKIKSLLKIKGFVTQGNHIFYLRFAKRSSLILLPRLYPRENVPCLQRKYKIVKNLLNN